MSCWIRCFALLLQLPLDKNSYGRSAAGNSASLNMRCLYSIKGREESCESCIHSRSAACGWRFHSWKGQMPCNKSITSSQPHSAELSLNPIIHIANVAVWMQICCPKGATGTVKKSGCFIPSFPVIARAKTHTKNINLFLWWMKQPEEESGIKNKSDLITLVTHWQEYKMARSPIFNSHYPAAVGLDLLFILQYYSHCLSSTKQQKITKDNK